MRATKSITVARPRNEVYSFWRDFENLPRFMHNLESVENLGGGRSHWRAKGIAGIEREWDAELVEDRPNERISWRTVHSDDHLRHAGTVSFLSVGDSATEVRVDVDYDAPGQQIEQDLERFQRVLETGDVERSARVEGLSDVDVRTQEPVEPVNREQQDPRTRI
jgi:uncharacterized membrane protein